MIGESKKKSSAVYVSPIVLFLGCIESFSGYVLVLAAGSGYAGKVSFVDTLSSDTDVETICFRRCWACSLGSHSNVSLVRGRTNGFATPV